MSDLFDEIGPTPQSPTQGATARQKGRFRTPLILAIVVMILSAVAVIVVPNVLPFNNSVSDYPGPGKGTVTITIPEGATGREIAAILEDADVVATANAFVKAYNAEPRAKSIQPGTFTLKKQMSGSGAVTALLDPSNKANITVTIPEGFTSWQVYERLASAFSLETSKVEAAAQAGIGLPEVAGGNPEGWFAPLTYTFEPDVTAKEALGQMVAARVSQLKQTEVSEADWEQLLIKASIVEREGNSQDYAKVARVIENRMVEGTEVNGLLQMDSTVLYGLKKSGGVPTSSELAQDTPFNTYIHTGLPPSPIGSPGMDAINAAIHPEAGDWLYFVTVNLDTGETKFAATLNDHNANVQEFREWLKQNPQD